MWAEINCVGTKGPFMTMLMALPLHTKDPATYNGATAECNAIATLVRPTLLAVEKLPNK